MLIGQIDLFLQLLYKFICCSRHFAINDRHIEKKENPHYIVVGLTFLQNFMKIVGRFWPCLI